jgi:threonine synthase
MTALLRCAVCGAEVAADTVRPWRCPNASESDRHHVLHRIPVMAPLRPVADPNPFIRFDAMLLWARTAEAHGMGLDDRSRLVRELDAAVASVAGTGFVETPLRRSPGLSDALGFRGDGGVWLKDETVDVAGSAKARHLFPILLHLIALERMGVTSDRPDLAIASCGNAALAAATLARAVDWPLEVFVPEHADSVVVERLAALRARVVHCPRRAADPPGDPCMHRFREAVNAGAIPFSVQGPENALCLDGGRTIGWEITERLGAHLSRMYVQVGGGALATSLGYACTDAGVHPRLIAVQAEGCAPMARAWTAWKSGKRRWEECMWPWETEPHSLATGILDDETYDWIGIARSLAASGGEVVVVDETTLRRANALVVEHTSIDADHTATAALAGLLAQHGSIDPDEIVVVPITGVRRHAHGH